MYHLNIGFDGHGRSRFLFIFFNMPRIRGVNWVFTLNNYTPAEVEALIQYATLNPISCPYLVFGKEVGESGTPHLQGFIRFESRKELAAVKLVVGDRAHVELARSPKEAIQYCKKDGDVTEIGVFSSDAGKRCDLEAFKDDVKSGTLNGNELMERHSKVYARYPKFVLMYCALHDKPKAVKFFPLKPWQQVLYEKLRHAPDDRTVFFIVDTKGNQGKSWFVHYYVNLHNDAQLIKPGKKADMAFKLIDTSRVVFIDTPRSKQGEYIHYDFLEEVKDGFVFSPKYESRMVYMKANVHVVVFMNEFPDMTKLSEDRYDVTDITNS